MSWFGDAVGVQQVRRAVYDTLQTWLPVALVDVARGDGWTLTPPASDGRLGFRDTPDGRAVLELPRSWHVLADYRSPDPAQLPNVAIGVAQSFGQTRRGGQPGGRSRTGMVDLTWMVNVAAVLRGQSYWTTSEVAGVYVTAVSLVLDQQLRRHQMIGDVAGGDSLEEYDGASDDESRTLAVTVASRLVSVHAARSQHPQVLEPPEDPFADPPAAPPEATSAATETTRSER